MRLSPQLAVLATALIAGAASPAVAASVSVAVAANFTTTAEAIAEAFEATTGNQVQLSFGATGGLYAQITQGAPFEVFLAADNTRPQTAIEAGLAVDGTAFTYAVGRLVLYSATRDVAAGDAVLAEGAFDKLAVADPQNAPYGAATVEALRALGLYDLLAPKLVTGENIAQTLQFVASGNAELGFVAQSQVAAMPAAQQWVVPAQLYSPIRQDAVLLKTGQDNPAALAFLDFLRSPAAVAIIETAGYGVGD